MNDPAWRSATAEELRREFDESFAVARRPPDAGSEDLLALRAGGVPYALRLRQLTGLEPARKIVPVGSPSVAVLGVAGYRGELLPVYSLAVLLGHPAGQEPARWLALAKGTEPIGLALDALEGHVRVKRDAIRREGAGEQGLEVVELGGAVRALLDVPSILAGLGSPGSRAGTKPTREEPTR